MMAKKNVKKRVNVFKGESNPFNIKVNREKHYILGQKVKGTKGWPVISRSASHMKRRELWHKTKVNVQKANKFVDKRLMDGSIPLEEQSTHRFVQERKKKLKKSIFNLNDDEDLTHRGVPLQDPASLNDKASGSEDEEQLDAHFVNEAHFGGFKTDPKEQPKSHKEIIEKLITESKQKKQEKKIAKELTDDLTEKLDKDWKEMCSLLSGIKTGQKKDVAEKNDAYDILTKELMFEMKGTPATRTKTLEELENEERERLYKLEEQRQARMVDEVDSKIKIAKNHLSADSIFDDFDLQPIPVEENIPENSSSHRDSEYSDSEESDSSSTYADLTEVEIEVSKPGTELNTSDVSTQHDKNVSLSIPVSLQEFEQVLHAHTPDEVHLVVEHILKHALHVKSEKMLNKLSVFFAVLLEYAFKNVNRCVDITGVLAPHLHALVNVAPINAAEKILSFLDKEYKLFQEQKSQTKKIKSLRHQTVLLLKYCSILFSVSDFRHTVVTPAILFICDILSSQFAISFQNITSRLFVCSIILDCISQSKRLVPEALCFLNKILTLAVPRKTDLNTKRKDDLSTKQKKFNLILSKKHSNECTTEINLFCSSKSSCEDSMKLSVIVHIVSQLQLFAALYSHLPSYSELFSQILAICSEVPINTYPSNVKDTIEKLKETIAEVHPVKHLVYENIKPKPLKLFEPAFDSKFTKNDSINKQYKLLKSVSQKIRKEEKGLLREMRRDVQMIGAEKLKERLESDAERKRKVKELYHDLATQEGEYKKLMKKTI